MSALHVEVIGRGPPLVLLHGWAMHGGVFAPLVERMQATRTLHIVDLPGHGDSRDCDVSLALEVRHATRSLMSFRWRPGAVGRWVDCLHCMQPTRNRNACLRW